MNVNIYLENSLAKSLDFIVKKSGHSRNAIIREAIKEWLQRHAEKQWPISILNFKGINDAPRFEADRDDLLPPKEDPFK